MNTDVLFEAILKNATTSADRPLSNGKRRRRVL